MKKWNENAMNGTFNNILELLKKHALSLTNANYMSFLLYEMETYNLVYEIEGLRLLKLSKSGKNGLNGGILPFSEAKVLARSKIEENGHKLAILECSEIELQAVHLELKNKVLTEMKK